MDALLGTKQQKNGSGHSKTRKKPVRRDSVILALIAAVVIITVVVVSLLGQQARASEPVIIEQASAGRGNITNTLEVAGILSNSGTNGIYAPSNLEIEEVLVEPGDSVAEGDALAKVEQTSLNIERYAVAERLVELESEIAATKSDTAEYYTLLKEQRKLHAKRTVLDGIALDNTIRATKSGVVDKVNVTAGSTVGAGVQAAEGSGDESAGSASRSNASGNENSAIEMPAAFKIASGENMTLTLNLDELDILLVKLGQKVSLAIDALAGQTFEGEITRIAKQSTSNGGVTKYSVEVTLAKTEGMLAGMNAAASIAINESIDVLTIPSAALKQQGTRTFVYTSKDAGSGELSGEVDIQIGNSDGSTIEVLSGLSEGATLYYETPSSTGAESSMPTGS